MSGHLSSAELFAEASRLAERASVYRRNGLHAAAEVMVERAHRLEARGWAIEAQNADDAVSRSRARRALAEPGRA